MGGFNLSFGDGFPSLGGFNGGFSGDGGFLIPGNSVVQPAATPQPIGSKGTGTWWGDLMMNGADLTKSFLTWDVMKSQIDKGQYPSVSYTGGGQIGALTGAGGVGTSGISGTFLFLIIALVVVLLLVK